MRTILIGVGFFIIVLLIFLVRLPSKTLEFECVIQPDKIVLNNLRKDELHISIAIQGNEVTQWRKGLSKAYVQQVTNINKDYVPYSGNKIMLKLFAPNSDFYFHGIVPKSCYDAV